MEEGRGTPRSEHGTGTHLRQEGLRRLLRPNVQQVLVHVQGQSAESERSGSQWGARSRRPYGFPTFGHVVSWIVGFGLIINKSHAKTGTEDNISNQGSSTRTMTSAEISETALRSPSQQNNPCHDDYATAEADQMLTPN